MNKILRQKIWGKYGGHCAYCGSEIAYTDMQVDHTIPQRNGGVDGIDSCNPSCRRCNHYKRAHGLETFREMLLTLPQRLDDIYIFKVAIDYEIVEIKGFDGKFYFEKMEVNHND
jgi:hypothetical protein